MEKGINRLSYYLLNFYIRDKIWMLSDVNFLNISKFILATCHKLPPSVVTILCFLWVRHTGMCADKSESVFC